MVRKLRAPIFFVNPKSYLYGDEVVNLAIHTDELAKKYDLDILFSAKDVDLKEIAQKTTNIIVTAQHMDGIEPGRGMGKVLPEALKAAGVQAIVLNHCECPLSISEITHAMNRAKELELLTFLIADSVADTKALANLHPDVMGCELTSLIGLGIKGDDQYIVETKEIVKEFSKDSIVMCGAGLKDPNDIYEAFAKGSEGFGGTTAIVKSPDMYKTVTSMIEQVVKARKDFF